MGRRRAGVRRGRARAAPKASASATSDDAITIAGRLCTSKVDRNSASRVALPAIWNAIRPADVAVAAATAMAAGSRPARGGVTDTAAVSCGLTMIHRARLGATVAADLAHRGGRLLHSATPFPILYDCLRARTVGAMQ